MLTITSVLSMFSLLVICSFVLFWSKRFNLPYTVSLVVVGLLLAALTNFSTLKPFLGFLTEFKLTPELLFYIFLPTLIFESAFNMKIRQIVENIWSISILSIVGLLISSVIIASLLYFLLPMVGLNIPFIVLFLFASIISATDPVAVLALFKEYGAPKRLTLIFEGESLFNDGTAVALFLVVLAVAQNGFHGFETVLSGIETFLMMIILGVVFGMSIAMLFTKFLKYFKTNEFVSITLLIISAHMIFIISELVNLNTIFGLHLHVSPIIATTIGALFLGNYARHVLSPKSEEYIEKSVGHLAFIVNSLVFILIGVMFATTQLNLDTLILPILITIIIVAFSRAVSIYSTVIPLNKLKLEKEIPTTWQHLLSWGSLRGALAIIIVLQIPDNFTVLGWTYTFTPKEFLIALTTGCILATLLIKATTIKKVMDYFNIYDNSLLHKISHLNTELMCLINEKKKIIEHVQRKFIITENDSNCDTLIYELDKKIEEITDLKNKLITSIDHKYFDSEIKLDAVKIEEKYLKELYNNDEISEKVYRRIIGKLNIQKEKHENLEENINISEYMDKKDWFDRFVYFFLNPLNKERNKLNQIELVEYYRAQSIISRKVVKNMQEVNNVFDKKVFDQDSFLKLINTYEEYKLANNHKLEEILKTRGEQVKSHVNFLNKQAIKTSGRKSLIYIFEKGLLNSSEFEHENSQIS